LWIPQILLFFSIALVFGALWQTFTNCYYARGNGITQTYQQTFSIKRLWIILSVGMIFMFGILLMLGAEIYQKAPPIPDFVESSSGELLCTRNDIETGQNVWQSIGGMEQGSIWGHGSYI